MISYKLTDKNGRTKSNTQWGEGGTHTAIGTSKVLCSDGWIHWYTSPHIAVLLNPIHANFKAPLIWEGEANGEILCEPLKSGSRVYTTLRLGMLPEISLSQRVAFGILSSLCVNKNKEYVNWANNWLVNKDRSANAAGHATNAANAAGHAAAYVAAYAAHVAAYAAANAAYTANVPYSAANAAYTANVASSAANAA